MNYPTALVTGGARGIGYAIVRQLFKQGFHIAVNYLHSKDHATQLVHELNRNSSGNQAIAVCADVSDSEQVATMFRQVNENLGSVHLLVNNAGIALQKLLTDTDEQEWERIFAVNAKGMFLCSKQALPQMIARKSGQIINISSMWGQIGASCEVAYSSAKAAVIGFTKALAKEVGPSGIRINCIAPGVIKTDMNRKLDNQTTQLLCEDTPLRSIGTPEHIAEAVGFLASEKAAFITGQVLGINGGMVI